MSAGFAFFQIYGTVTLATKMTQKKLAIVAPHQRLAMWRLRTYEKSGLLVPIQVSPNLNGTRDGFTQTATDVGGGDVSDDTPHSVSFVSLRWMIAQTIKCQTGIIYKPGALQSLGF